jgi:hypothetical protein
MNAQVQLVSAADTVLASRKLDYPLATLESAPLHGLPSPAWFLTIDETAPMGSYSGPATEMLTPAHSGLEPVGYESTQGHATPLVLARTGNADWKVMPPRSFSVRPRMAATSSPRIGRTGSSTASGKPLHIS